MKRQNDAFVLSVLTAVKEGKTKVCKAAQNLGISRQYLTKLLKAYEEEGPSCLIHGNKGKETHNRLDPDSEEKIVRLYLEKYQGFNFVHFSEKLSSDEGVRVSYHAVHRILTDAGIGSPRKHKRKRKDKAHPSRPRRECYGELVQMDASWHNWFGDGLPKATLLGAIDDATGTVLALRFERNETLAGYREILAAIMENHGLPEAFYTDNRTVFEYQKAEKSTTNIQFAEWCKDLAIDVITTSVPQAKGKIERLWETLQSRLVSEMAINGIKDIEGANAFLPGYVAEYNSRFASKPDPSKSVFRKSPSREMREIIMSLRERRIADNGGCFSYLGRRLRIVGEEGFSLPIQSGTEVEVMELRDGRIMARIKYRIYETRPAPDRQPIEKKKPEQTAQVKEKPKSKSPWRNFVINPWKKGNRKKGN